MFLNCFHFNIVSNREHYLDITKSICNAVQMNELTGDCVFGSYEVDRGFQRDPTGGDTFLDNGNV